MNSVSFFEKRAANQIYGAAGTTGLVSIELQTVGWT